MGLKILVADDSKTMRKIILRTLQTVGVSEVAEAVDGIEAMELFHEGNFDAVITDWNMPGKTGLEVLQEIRKLGSEVPVVIVSTEVEKHRILEAIKAGASEYLFKPFDAATRAKLEKILRKLQYKDQQLENFAEMDFEYINSFLAITMSVFENILNCKLTRGEPYLADGFQPQHEISGVIDLSGKIKGTMVLSLSRSAALGAAIPMSGTHPTEINEDVIDVVGELANIIAGNAQAEFEDASVRVNPPQVVTGKGKCLDFPKNSKPICIPLECKWGPLVMELALEEEEEEKNVLAAS